MTSSTSVFKPFKKMHAVTARNIGALFETQALTDFTVSAGGEEIKAHRAVLAAQSEFLRSRLASAPMTRELELKTSGNVARALVRAMYCLAPPALSAQETLDFLREARIFGISELVDRRSLARSVVVTMDNCSAMLVHDELRMHQELYKVVLDFVGNNLHAMIGEDKSRRKLLETSDQVTMLQLLKTAACVTPPDYVDLVIRFAADWAGRDSVCDLLREAKMWPWAPADSLAPLFLDGVPVNNCLLDLSKIEEGSVRQLQARGEFFDWSLRLELSADRKLRIVYESAVAVAAIGHSDAPILRFPAALFDWKINGVPAQEKSVFICFPQGVNLHWSTTLSLTGKCELSLNLIELPLNSLILYSFASDLPATLQSEDILNRLPHIEFRCVSSYLLYQQHGLGAGSPNSSIISMRRFA